MPTDPCLCSTYATDALSFLSRESLGRYRHVSRRFNDIVVNGWVSGQLRARRIVHEFRLYVHNKRVPHVYSPDGFKQLETTESGLHWIDVPEHNACCGEWLATAAAPLIGQRIFLGAAFNTLVSFSLWREDPDVKTSGAQCLTLALRNELTIASAVALLHFARHIGEELCFKALYAFDYPEIEQCGLFNPAILSTLARERRQRGIRQKRWIHAQWAYHGERLLRSRPYQLPLQEVAAIGMLTMRLGSLMDVHVSPIIDFITQMGSFTREVQISIPDPLDRDETMDFLGRVITSLFSLSDLRDTVHRLILDFERPYLSYGELISEDGAPLTRLAYDQPRVTNRVEKNNNISIYQFPPLAANKPRQCVRMTLKTRRGTNGGKVEVALCVKLKMFS